MSSLKLLFIQSARTLQIKGTMHQIRNVACMWLMNSLTTDDLKKVTVKLLIIINSMVGEYLNNFIG